MRTSLVFLAALSALLLVSGCASVRRANYDDELMSAFLKEGKTVELKVGRGGEVYVIDPTQTYSERGCPLARITGWRDGEVIEDKVVEVCR
jgi:hypothetical protein